MSDDPTRSDGPPLTTQQLKRFDAEIRAKALAGRAEVMRVIDLAEGRTEPHPSTRAAEADALAGALALSDAMLERSLGVEPGSIQRAALEEIDAHASMVEKIAQGAPGEVVTAAYAAGITQPIKRPAVPLRPIDEAEWVADQFRPKVDVRVDSTITYETAPCPKWMKPETYRWLLARLAQGMREAPQTPLDHLHAWIARHVYIVWTPPKIVSSASAADLIGPALEFVRQAKRHGLTNEELARGGRRRLLR